MASEKKSPFIIGIGDTKNKIHQFMIVLDGNLIPLSTKCNILDAIDYVFKLHFIFEIKYDHNLRLFWVFIQKYIYGMDVNNLPTTVREIYHKLSALVE